MDLNEARRQLARQAVRFEIGGFRPPDRPEASWFGRVNLAAAGQGWPTTGGAPMHALCQINVLELPFQPPGFEDLALVTVFIGPDELPFDSRNGDLWCLRTYTNLDVLVPLEQLDTGSPIKPFPMRPQVIPEDFPMWEDVTIDLPTELKDNYYDLFENVSGFKLGGWPTLIQSEIGWAPQNGHTPQPEFAFQIDSSEKGNWAWGDNGVGYFGRGTKPGHEHEWACRWQCY